MNSGMEYRGVQYRLDSRIVQLSRKQAGQSKGSLRRQRTKLRPRRLHHKGADFRKTHNHRVSCHVAGLNSTVVVEDLNTTGMTHSAKGTAENPSRDVKAKPGLNREILRSGWHLLQQMLAYECNSHIAAAAALTRQTNSCCDHVDAESRKGRKFASVACGRADHADLNAARNLLTSGIGAAARPGALTSVTPQTRETDRML